MRTSIIYAAMRGEVDNLREKLDANQIRRLPKSDGRAQYINVSELNNGDHMFDDWSPISHLLNDSEHP